MDSGEVLYPNTKPIRITRSDEWTLVTFHIGADPEWVVQEIARSLDPAHEIGSWITPFTGNSVDLRALINNPLGYLKAQFPQAMKTPPHARYIPPPLQAPWAKH